MQHIYLQIYKTKILEKRHYFAKTQNEVKTFTYYQYIK